MSAEREESGLRRRRSMRPRFPALPGPARLLLDAIGLWRERRRTRRHLARLSDYMLKDIGISRADAVEELEKPFWRK